MDISNPFRVSPLFLYASLRLYRNKQDIVGTDVLDRPATQRVASPDRRQSACGRGRDAEDNPRGGDVVPYKNTRFDTSLLRGPHTGVASVGSR